MDVEWMGCYKGYTLIKYVGDTTIYLGHKNGKHFKNLKSALWYLRMKRLRQRRKHLNRKKRNQVKLEVKKWMKVFEEVFDGEDKEEIRVENI